MSRKQQPSLHRRKPLQEEQQRLHSHEDIEHYPHKKHSTSRISRKNQPFWDFISNPLGSFFNPRERWWYVSILVFALIGAICGSLWLPNGLFGLNGLRIGVAIFFTLGALLKAIVNEIRTTSYSHNSLLWWSILLFTAICGGAILGFFLLPDGLLVPSRIFWGACFGCIGLLLPTVFIRVFIIDHRS